MGMPRILGEVRSRQTYSTRKYPGARVIAIVARYRVFRSVLFTRLARFVYSLMSQSLTFLAVMAPEMNSTLPDLLLFEFQ